MKHTIRERFPEVRQITAEELRAALASSAAPLLIDARTGAEYRVSQLADARRAATLAEADKALAGVSTDRAIVVYCSVGYRSAALARELMRLGCRNVANLQGSIFEWANMGWPAY